MSQHDYNISTADANTGPSFRAAVNSALQALVGNNWGNTAPASPYAHMFWVDTSGATPLLKIRNSANDAWIYLFSLGADQLLLANDIEINGVTIGLGGGNINTNTAYGKEALSANVSGTFLTAIGAYALSSIINGSVNIGIGPSALSGIVATSNNIGIGSSAGASAPGPVTVTSAYSSIFIGNYTMPSANGNGYEIVIGDGVQGRGSNTATLGDAEHTYRTYLHGVVSVPVLSTGIVTRTTTTYTIPDTITSLIANYAGTMTLTLPAAASYAGRIIVIKTIQAQAVVSASANVTPLAGGAAGTAILSASAGKFAQLQSDGTTWQIMQAN